MAHARQQNEAGFTLSSKINNNGSKSIYDDVYGGPPKFGVSSLSPRFEDYGEIFGSFHTPRASSIPLLDLPAVHDADAFFDPRSQAFNYTEVFGALDFAVPYENLFRHHTALDGASEEEAWSLAETDSFSGESDQSANNQSMSNGYLFHSVDGNAGFNVLYHNKANGTSNECKSKGKTHMTRLHAVPGFSRVYDETTQLHQTDPSFQDADVIDVDMEFSADKVEGNRPRKTIAHLRKFTTGEQTFDSDLNIQNGGSRKDSHSREMFITVSDINLRSMPSQVPPPCRPPPPALDAKKRSMSGFHSNSRLVVSEETPGAGSPPFFNVEDHMNSSATASADAMKEAMLRAEAKLRSAKELKERKKGDCESHSKSSYDAKINEAKMCKDITRLSSLNDHTLQGRHSKTKLSVTDYRQKLKKASPETLDNLEGKRVLNMFEEKDKIESRSSQESDRSSVGTWKDESEFFELVGIEESRRVTQPTKQIKDLVQGTETQKVEREASNVQEKHKQVKATAENYQGEAYEKKYKAAKQACEHDENIMKSEASNGKQRQREQMKKEKMAKVFEVEDNEKSIKIAHQHGKTEKKVTEADQSGIIEDVCEMGHGEHKQVEIQKPKEVDRQTPNEVQLKEASKLRENEAYGSDQNRKKFKDVYGEGNRLQEAGDNKGIQKVMNQTPMQEQINGMLNEAQRKKVTEGTSSQTLAMEGSVDVSNENSHLEQSENMEQDVGGMEKDKGLNKAFVMERNEEEGNMKNAKATDETEEIESEEDLAAQSTSIHEEFIGKLKVSKKSVADQDIGKMRAECEVGEKKLKEIGVENQLANEKIRAPEMTAGDAEHLGTQSEKEGDTVTKADNRGTEATGPVTVQETVNVQKTAQWFHVGQSTESKAKSTNETSSMVKNAERMGRESEKDLTQTEEEGDREREREKDVEKAMLEAERERERQKDRMAVDRATFEARDRAYAEACERAAFERATVEVRYKALAEARERLEKACTEARDKSNIDKETIEARLKAERAAVERATAEAQDQAMEKLKNERTAFESREQLERSVSDKFCRRQDSSSSDMLDPQFQNLSSSTGSRHPYSLYGAASFSERSEREGESAQRCRARLERHRRTAERAAKALAEKNMRDLLAQKEQAERNRLSETLDAEVRRWSGGKEGNLRALLSTLQYILGPDSGWQLIPLTEVITSAAVKKAYRKATLCVHPDKLQQRGASIQHKYICEKVFDLLKEAWNKFNSEER
ncbi:hypothetical protein GLYMA_11G071000v4 [Glycine max]|nr:hypothetical protein GLYMA_11G071000v4 [Glycine max]KAH1157975.1 hypothetical protein GYH30_030286 [Glycine max]